VGKEDINTRSGTEQNCSTFSVVLLTQASPQHGESEREPGAAFDIVMLYGLLHLSWQGAPQLGEGLGKACLVSLVGPRSAEGAVDPQQVSFLCCREPELSLRLMYLGFLCW